VEHLVSLNKRFWAAAYFSVFANNGNAQHVRVVPAHPKVRIFSGQSVSFEYRIVDWTDAVRFGGDGVSHRLRIYFR
jgi:hypothetical protein